MSFNKNLFLILLTFYNILLAGFVPTTLVKTPIGYTEIQYLKKGDFVISFNGKELVANKVTHANSYVVKELATIYFSDGSKSACSLDQKFYLPMQDKWVIAKSLCKNDFLISVHGIYKTVEDVVISTNETSLYEITVENDHNYYASDVLVHNVMIGAAFAFGGGAVEFAGASVTVLGGLLGFMFSKKKKHKQNQGGLSIGDVAVSFGGSPDPGDDKEKKIGIFEKSLKHIFRNGKGHLKDTPYNRKLLSDVASNKKNYLGVDKYGNEWLAKNLSSGEQIWVSVRGGSIRNGGINKIPKSFNTGTGLCQINP